MTFTLCINGKDRSISSDPETPLLFVLRDELKLKGSKLGCGLEQCGACAVLVDGKAEFSCSAPAETFIGRDIVTIEGISGLEIGRRVQAAFVDANAAQCGYCTAGMVIAVTGVLTESPHLDRRELKPMLDNHLCRCGAHPRVLRAAEMAIERS